jgi:hypothetical protein
MLRILIPALVLATAAATAAEPPPPPRSAEPPPWAQELAQAEALAREGLAKMLLSVEKLLQALPQYELPELAVNGDIVIWRKPAPPPARRDPNLL